MHASKKLCYDSQPNFRLSLHEKFDSFIFCTFTVKNKTVHKCILLTNVTVNPNNAMISFIILNIQNASSKIKANENKFFIPVFKQYKMMENDLLLAFCDCIRIFFAKR